jgi:hypothetical protein
MLSAFHSYSFYIRIMIYWQQEGFNPIPTWKVGGNNYFFCVELMARADYSMFLTTISVSDGNYCSRSSKELTWRSKISNMEDGKPHCGNFRRSGKTVPPVHCFHIVVVTLLPSGIAMNLDDISTNNVTNYVKLWFLWIGLLRLSSFSWYWSERKNLAEMTPRGLWVIASRLFTFSIGIFRIIIVEGVSIL